ncbi:hypothetical protein [Thauera butanivorans]|uniref:hypothetical protein n=1 Tax=Thauera butanivorans TaxID=86174 RepID=UPI0008380514|nr:hypothetical protein [Thauera butanivorans]
MRNKEHPVLFTGSMVRAIMEGRKAQTRRKVKPKQMGRITGPIGPGMAAEYHGIDNDGCAFYSTLQCPYGQPGDRLWVRENGWERPQRTPRMMREGADTWEPYYYDADGITDEDAADLKRWGFKRRPSIHMPRHCCRLVLEITGVRIERLQDISEADAKAEGIPQSYLSPSRIPEFSDIWESINGPGSWGANPWVWVIEFKRVTS